MAQALYRRFRSQTFDELIGQDHITKLLKNAVSQGKVSHAYLFVGSRGIGKTSAARILAKAVNCLSPEKDGNPCNKCLACQAITNGRYLDLIEIDAASNRGIDQIRELKEKIEFSPAEGRYKVYIIDEVHMLTTEAFNALLKTLEEPPEHVIFILATTEAFRLPPTILSRCQRYDFKLGTDELVASSIEKVAEDINVKLDEGATQLLVKSAQGSYRDALSLLDVVINSQIEGDSPSEISQEEVEEVLGVPDSVMVTEFLSRLVENDAMGALELLNELSCYGVNFQQLIKLTLEILREILIAVISEKNVQAEYPFVSKLNQKEIIGMIGIFLEAERGLHSAVIPGLIVEMVIPKIQMLLGAEIAEPIADVDNDGDNSDTDGNNSGDDSPKPDKSVKVSAEKKTKKKKKTRKTKSSAKTKTAKSKPADKKNIAESSDADSKISSKLKKDSPKASKSESSGDLTVEDIKKSWTKIKNEVKEQNGHLLAILQSSEISKLSGNTLVMNVIYEFHKDRLESPKSRDVMCQVFEKVLGYRISYECKVEKKNSCKRQVSKEILMNGVPKGYNLASAKQKKEVAKGSVVKPPDKKSEAAAPRLTSKKVEEIFSGL
ncbi:DNA polymerase III subunit gamma/tau [Candidatus Dojkabacteria bacterium]|nr:DNA polymerase III subunit gamma/tau [Candidatus Dojkabacteria bacterium]